MWWFQSGNRQGAIADFGLQDRPAGIDRLTTDIVETMEPTSSDRLPADVLIVEDDPIIVLDLEDTLLGLGIKTVRIAANVAKAMAIIAGRAPDFALLDVGLIREKSFAIAERLAALNIPFAFVTGYGPDVHLPAAFANTPRLLKPFSAQALEALLRRRPAG
jgi:CheY-like chemotaxis protein